jgi:hypothetical protein
MMEIIALTLMLPAMIFMFFIGGFFIAYIVRKELRFFGIIGSFIFFYYYLEIGDSSRGINATQVNIIFWLSLVLSFIIWCWVWIVKNGNGSLDNF